MEEHREYSATGLEARSPLQTPSSVGFQAIWTDDVTTQTKPLGCHQPDIGVVIPTVKVMGKAVPGRTKMDLNVLISVITGKQGPDLASLRTRSGGRAPGARVSLPGCPALVS